MDVGAHIVRPSRFGATSRSPLVQAAQPTITPPLPAADGAAPPAASIALEALAPEARGRGWGFVSDRVRVHGQLCLGLKLLTLTRRQRRVVSA